MPETSGEILIDATALEAERIQLGKGHDVFREPTAELWVTALQWQCVGILRNVSRYCQGILRCKADTLRLCHETKQRHSRHRDPLTFAIPPLY